MNPLAQELNDILAGSTADALLSDYGRRMYFPKGIISQSAEAKQKATRYNATIGIATQDSKAMCLPSVYESFDQSFGTDELFAYSPTAGEPALRKAWLDDMIYKNPSLKGKNVSLPVVTCGLTHAISVASSLFLDKDEVMIVPDMFWGNYTLIFVEQRLAKVASFPLFANGGLNIAGLEAAIDASPGNRAAMILNFPNNPTGYTPTKDEAKTLVDMLVKKAEAGKKLLVFTDDAYFGLFFEESTSKESLFALLANAHENIFAVKGDAATKEEMVWGFRVGFITYGNKGMTAEQYAALEKKTMGAIRGCISSCAKPSQTILLKAMKSPNYHAEKEAGIKVMNERYHMIKKVLATYKDNKFLTPLPFNSGYFMSFICAGDAEALRLYLMDTYQTGAISIQGKYLRLAFSSINVENIEALVKLVYQAAEEVFTK